MKAPMVWLLITLVVAIGFAYWIQRKLASVAVGSDGWLWPLPGRTAISSGYGWRTHPITGQRKFHNGIDIPAPTGTPVLAPFAGRVKSVFENTTGGKQVIIEHDDGRLSGYAHLHVVLVDPGERIAQGEPFAQVGSTGGSTGPHLHFTVRPSAAGDHINPQTLFA